MFKIGSHSGRAIEAFLYLGGFCVGPLGWFTWVVPCGGGPCRDAAADKQAASDNVGEEKEGEVLSTLATDLGSLVLPAETRCREASIMWRPAQLPLA